MSAFIPMSGTGGTGGTGSSLIPLPPVHAMAYPSDTIAIEANDNRRGLVIINNGATDVYLGIGQAAIQGAGFLLSPYGTWTMSSNTFTTAAIHVVSNSSSLSIQEFI